MRPYLRVANVFDGQLDLSDVLQMHFAERDIEKYELRPGDILLNEGQSRELVGRSAIYGGEIPGACFQMTLLRFRCHPDLDYRFAHAFFQHCLYTGQFAAMCLKTTSIAHLSAAGLSSMSIPVPPMRAQLALVKLLGHIDMAISQLNVRRSQIVALIDCREQ